MNNKTGNYKGTGIAIMIVFILLLIIKTFLIFYPIRLDSTDQTYLNYLWSDIPILFIILFFIYINTFIKSTILRIISNIFSFTIILHYYIDIILIIYFQSRAFVPEIFEFINQGTISSFVEYGLILFITFIILLIISFFISKKIEFKKKDFGYIFILFIIYLISYFTFGNSIVFMGNILTLNPIYRIANGGYYQPECKTTYKDQLTTEQGKGKKLNIILIFLESFSAIDSKNAGGNNNMPLFDEIQKDGIIFTNFLANGGESSSAHLTTLYGIPIGRFGGYKQFNHLMDPLPQYFYNLGYQTTFISTADTSFLNQREFLKESGFKKIIGEENFENKKSYTFGSAPDEYLYQKALEELSLYKNKKFFIGMQTISTHKPYDTPYGDTESLALKYSEEKLYNFYNELKKTDFFNSGMLILISDHRMMNPIKPGEFEKFGESWGQRVVATVIGSGIDKGIINNNIIQHTDVYNSIKKLVGSGTIQLDKYYNDMFSNNINRNRSIRTKGGSTASKNKYDIYYQNGNFMSLEADKLDILDENLYEYICSTLAFHDEKLDNLLKIHR